MLVQFRRGVADVDKATALGRINATLVDDVVMTHQRSDGKGDLHLVRLPFGLGVAAAMRGLQNDQTVEFAEPNWIYRHQATSNDTYYTNGSLWGMYGDASSPANQYGSQAAEAWAANKTDCGSVYVGIIDEGYMYTHEDLAANAGTNPGEIAGNGVDDDGNGYVDDVYGWDFDGNDNTVFDGVNDDHGTHVAGTIGGSGGNGKGVAGVCWSVKLINAKFLGSNGGTTANAIKAVDYMTDLKTRARSEPRRDQQLLGWRRILAGALRRHRACESRASCSSPQRATAAGMASATTTTSRRTIRRAMRTPTSSRWQRSPRRAPSPASRTSAPPPWTSARPARASGRRCRSVRRVCSSRATPPTAAPRWRRRM